VCGRRSVKRRGSVVCVKLLINNEDDLKLEHTEDEACWRNLLKKIKIFMQFKGGRVEQGKIELELN
jgi:hypothetical protein